MYDMPLEIMFDLPKESIGSFRQALAHPEKPSPFSPLIELLPLLPELKRQYAQRNIPAQILFDTMRDVGVWVRTHHRAHGEWGFSEQGWLKNHFGFKLFKLGRVQFVLCEGYVPAMVYERNGEIRLMAPEQMRYRRDGQTDGTCGNFDSEAFTTRLEQKNGTITGHLIHPDRGMVQRELSTLGPDWRLLYAPQTMVLDMHIPEEGPLDIPACIRSFYSAMDFFSRYFPETPFAGFTIESWLLGWPVAKALPGHLNLPRFQKLFYSVPIKEDMEQTLQRVYGHGHRPESAQGAPRDTTLRRVVADLWASGREIFGCGGFIPILEGKPQFYHFEE
ncbi:MAG TPA: DUF5596 domain-containing protein [Candidatus Faecaligallichristensenella faecipullorum]|nr:DUF5596 domain-containing protein [Candidatus Faecaligallichristensenella faecipullorum]